MTETNPHSTGSIPGAASPDAAGRVPNPYLNPGTGETPAAGDPYRRPRNPAPEAAAERPGRRSDRYDPAEEAAPNSGPDPSGEAATVPTPPVEGANPQPAPEAGDPVRAGRIRGFGSRVVGFANDVKNNGFGAAVAGQQALNRVRAAERLERAQAAVAENPTYRNRAVLIGATVVAAIGVTGAAVLAYQAFKVGGGADVAAHDAFGGVFGSPSPSASPSNLLPHTPSASSSVEAHSTPKTSPNPHTSPSANPSVSPTEHGKATPTVTKTATPSASADVAPGRRSDDPDRQSTAPVAPPKVSPSPTPSPANSHNIYPPAGTPSNSHPVTSPTPSGHPTTQPSPHTTVTPAPHATPSHNPNATPGNHNTTPPPVVNGGNGPTGGPETNPGAGPTTPHLQGKDLLPDNLPNGVTLTQDQIDFANAPAGGGKLGAFHEHLGPNGTGYEGTVWNKALTDVHNLGYDTEHMNDGTKAAIVHHYMDLNGHMTEEQAEELSDDFVPKHPTNAQLIAWVTDASFKNNHGHILLPSAASPAGKYWSEISGQLNGGNGGPNGAPVDPNAGGNGTGGNTPPANGGTSTGNGTGNDHTPTPVAPHHRSDGAPTPTTGPTTGASPSPHTSPSAGVVTPHASPSHSVVPTPSDSPSASGTATPNIDPTATTSSAAVGFGNIGQPEHTTSLAPNVAPTSGEDGLNVPLAIGAGILVAGVGTAGIVAWRRRRDALALQDDPDQLDDDELTDDPDDEERGETDDERDADNGTPESRAQAQLDAIREQVRREREADEPEDDEAAPGR